MNVKEVIQTIIHYISNEKTPMNIMLNYTGKYNREIKSVMKLLQNFDERKINIAKALTSKKTSYFRALASNVVEKSTVKLLEDNDIIPKTVDVLLEGNAESAIKGIQVCYMPTIEVINNAINNNLNMIITHEPLYYNCKLGNDDVYLQKKRLITDNSVNVYRLHDLLHLFQPDILVTGILKALNMEHEASFTNSGNVVIEKSISKQELYYLLSLTLNAQNMRVVGNLEGNIDKFGLLIGSLDGLTQISHMSSYNLPLIICGEIHENEISEYVRDANALGHDKTLIVLGHKESEAVGMEYFSKWLKKHINSIPINYFDSVSPFSKEHK